jgi:signal transduction histidine kinase
MAESADKKRLLRPTMESTDPERFNRDVRNQITVISARVQLLRRRINNGSLELEDLERSLQQIQRATTRLTELINRRDALP